MNPNQALQPKRIRLQWTWPATGDKLYTSPYGHGANTQEEAQELITHMLRIGYTNVKIISQKV